MKRLYIHFDLDYFFAQVEEKDMEKAGINIKNKPIIVGGISGRGVVSTCNYVARSYGVRSGMSTYEARNLAPHAIFLPVRYERYVEVSEVIYDIYRKVTPKIETLGLDEAFLEIKSDYESAIALVADIKKEILAATSLSVSAGISYNMLNAKIASDVKKPNGIFVIKEQDVESFFRDLPIGKIFGIGTKTVERFNNMNLFTIGDIMHLPREFFQEYFGNSGASIYDKIRGIDNRQISINTSKRKSYGRETTFTYDINQTEDLEVYINQFSKEISDYLQENNIHAKTITVKYKTINFETHSKSKTLSYYTNNYKDIYNVALAIMNSIDFSVGVRLIGVSISNIENQGKHQLELF